MRLGCREPIPQGLKPACFVVVYGTAKAVTFPIRGSAGAGELLAKEIELRSMNGQECPFPHRARSHTVLLLPRIVEQPGP
jgi:hypothetical protein